MSNRITQGEIVTKGGWIEHRGRLRGAASAGTDLSKRELLDAARRYHAESQKTANMAEAYIRRVEQECARKLENERKLREIVQQHQGETEAESGMLRREVLRYKFLLASARKQLLMNGALLLVVAVSLLIIASQ